jgi:TPR repeat protein
VIQALRDGGPRARMAAAWAVALVLGALTVTLADLSYRILPRPQPLEELSYYPSGQNLELVSLGHAQAAADLAWLRAVQYYGEHRVTDMRFTRMTHVFDILTSLSPGFTAAYVFGAFAMAQEGFDFPEAEKLMLKGLSNNPRSGVLAFELGFLYYMRPGGRDLHHAAEYFEQAARQPDGPPESERFAAYSRQNAGDLHIAYELWLEVSRSSANKYLRQMAEREMRRIREALATGDSSIAVKRLTTPQVLIRPR